jgi:DUF1365 family protein
MTASALYAGSVVHERLRPRRHRLRYRVFWLLLDLDEIETLDRRLRLFSHGRWNLLSFRGDDYGPNPSPGPGREPLRTQIEDQLRTVGIEPDGGPIAVLTMPRVLGYAFNPLSVYFCRRRDGGLAAIVYEVNNTFGQRHSYVAPVDGDGAIQQRVDKAFYVSPFLDMDLAYEFRVSPPGEHVALSILASDREGVVLSATLEGTRRPLTDAAILRACLAFPFVTLAVIAGIHWEALRIWLKGVRLRRRPPPPATRSTAAALAPKDA